MDPAPPAEWREGVKCSAVVEGVIRVGVEAVVKPCVGVGAVKNVACHLIT